MDITSRWLKGLTQVELLTTVAIVGISTALALPSLQGMQAKNAMSSNVNLFLAQLHLARSSAVTRGKRVTLCPTTNGTECNNDPKKWRDGYLVFEDTNSNRQRDSDEQIISYQKNTTKEIRIVSSSRHRNRISYIPLGRSWFSNTTVRFCHDKQPAYNRAIVISNTGKAQALKTLRNGDAVTCD
ncbi:MAG TPA: hypothetical protein ENJ12_11355 [Thiolapillus brandeum]|uniref:Type II secretion system protein H n=1 Tax=Thiolapillus brandeum TaxID=1076588 RepID=A0A831WDS0_9GAMM|nr:hypothetical protein [Thiolapillus brandeum]